MTGVCQNSADLSKKNVNGGLSCCLVCRNQKVNDSNIKQYLHLMAKQIMPMTKLYLVTIFIYQSIRIFGLLYAMNETMLQVAWLAFFIGGVNQRFGDQPTGFHLTHLQWPVLIYQSVSGYRRGVDHSLFHPTTLIFRCVYSYYFFLVDLHCKACGHHYGFAIYLYSYYYSGVNQVLVGPSISWDPTQHWLYLLINIIINTPETLSI